MKKLPIILCTTSLLLLAPCRASAEPAAYRTVAFEGKYTEVSFWYGDGKMPTDTSIVVANTRRGKVYTVKLAYWTGRSWAKARTMTARAKKDGEPLFFTAALHGIRNRKGADVKLKINGKLVKIAIKK